jgi:hypothetical protein
MVCCNFTSSKWLSRGNEQLEGTEVGDILWHVLHAEFHGYIYRSISTCNVCHRTRWSRGNVLDSYSGDVGFEFRPEHLLSSHRIVVVYLSSCRQILIRLLSLLSESLSMHDTWVTGPCDAIWCRCWQCRYMTHKQEILEITNCVFSVIR